MRSLIISLLLLSCYNGSDQIIHLTSFLPAGYYGQITYYAPKGSVEKNTTAIGSENKFNIILYELIGYNGELVIASKMRYSDVYESGMNVNVFSHNGQEYQYYSSEVKMFVVRLGKETVDLCQPQPL